MVVLTGLYVSYVEGLQPKSVVRQLFFYLFLSFYFYLLIQRDLWLDLNQG